jgi:hypothetical protein
MPARVPLDVDLEDRLVYGLTPTRLAYAVISLLGGFALWSSNWAPAMFRALAALVVIVIGVAMSWGRWRGTPADVWLIDVVLFTARTRQVIFTQRRPRILETRM